MTTEFLEVKLKRLYDSNNLMRDRIMDETRGLTDKERVIYVTDMQYMLEKFKKDLQYRPRKINRAVRHAPYEKF